MLVPNPDFEKDILGWPSRGWQVERCTTVQHGGTASLKITGEVGGQNEFVNTRYDASTSPMEIRWLKPGGTYELSAWLRVDRLPDKAPAPNLRIAFRDINGSRTAAGTNAYDLAKLGTWQRLSGIFTVPDWNTRNYVALNTNCRDPLAVEIYLDDVHIAPAGSPAPQQPVLVRLEPTEAALDGKAKVVPNPNFLGEPCVTGPGSATWTARDLPQGTYQLWGRLDANTEIGAVRIGEQLLAEAVRPAQLGWHSVARIHHAGGDVCLRLDQLSGSARVGRLVLANVASEEPAR
jgi:hypothetical protein